MEFTLKTAKTGLLIAIAWLGSLFLMSTYRDDFIDDKHIERPRIRAFQHKPDQVSTTEKSTQNREPNPEYELIRRKIDNGVTELWYYISAQLKEISPDLDPKHRKRVEELLDNGIHQQRSILTDVYNLSKYDNYEEWRERESADLRDLVQKRLNDLQNPKNCSAAKKIYCDLNNNNCGFGCAAHHVSYCMSVAYATGRTLVLDSQGWKYARNGWETVFQPLSNTCRTTNGVTPIRWTDPKTPAFQEAQVVAMPNGWVKERADFLPMAIPEDLSDRLIRLHGDPFAWWIGQITAFIMRPQKELLVELNQAKQRLGFQSPIVGIQVRRTDKLWGEAKFHAIEEYMVHVENYFQTLMRRQRVKVKRAYLATDDAKLLSQAKDLYPDYEFISDNDISKSAARRTRYSENSLRGIITDIHFLSHSDFLVCTFSSNVCRLCYELMQGLHPDASTYVRSLDATYFVFFMNPHYQVALYPHEAQNSDEISFQPGDLIQLVGNKWNGYSRGIIPGGERRKGLYPSYKVKNKIEIAKMPYYAETDSYDERK